MAENNKNLTISGNKRDFDGPPISNHNKKHKEKNMNQTLPTQPPNGQSAMETFFGNDGTRSTQETPTDPTKSNTANTNKTKSKQNISIVDIKTRQTATTIPLLQHQKEIEALKKREAALKANCEKHEKAQKILKDECNKLQNNYNSIKDKEETFKNKFKDFMKEHRQNQNDLRSALQKVETLQNGHDEYKENEQQRKDVMDTLQSNHNALTIDFDELQKKYKNLQILFQIEKRTKPQSNDQQTEQQQHEQDTMSLDEDEDKREKTEKAAKTDDLSKGINECDISGSTDCDDIYLRNTGIRITTDETLLFAAEIAATYTNNGSIKVIHIADTPKSWDYLMSSFAAGQEEEWVLKLFKDKAIRRLKGPYGPYKMGIYYTVPRGTRIQSLGAKDVYGKAITARPDAVGNEFALFCKTHGFIENQSEIAIIAAPNTQRQLAIFNITGTWGRRRTVVLTNRDGAVLIYKKKEEKDIEVNQMGERDGVFIAQDMDEIIIERAEKDMGTSGAIEQVTIGLYLFDTRAATEEEAKEADINRVRFDTLWNRGKQIKPNLNAPLSAFTTYDEDAIKQQQALNDNDWNDNGRYKRNSGRYNNNRNWNKSRFNKKWPSKR